MLWVCFVKGYFFVFFDFFKRCSRLIISASETRVRMAVVDSRTSFTTLLNPQVASFSHSAQGS